MYKSEDLQLQKFVFIREVSTWMLNHVDFTVLGGGSMTITSFVFLAHMQQKLYFSIKIY